MSIGQSEVDEDALTMFDSFKRELNRDLIKDLISKLHGYFKDGIIILFKEPISYDCWSFKKAIKYNGTNGDTLIEI